MSNLGVPVSIQRLIAHLEKPGTPVIEVDVDTDAYAESRASGDGRREKWLEEARR